MSAKGTERICAKGHRYYKSTDCPSCPVCEKEKIPAEGFTVGLSAPANRALKGMGITTLQQLSQFSEKELLKAHGFGPASLPALRKALAAAGLHFREYKDLHKFRAKIAIIGINPYVLLPGEVLQSIFSEALKDKGPVPVKGTIDGHAFKQTLVKYSGKWRLYLNGEMRTACGKETGDTVTLNIQYDGEERITPMPAALEAALNKNKKAAAIFNGLPPYLQKEIMRYINALKTTASIDRNVKKAIAFLSGKERFIGRDHP
jgi:hypothetical protein